MHYALPHKNKYPIETAEQVKTASVYFTKHLSSFSPIEKAVVAGALEKRAHDLGISVDVPWAKNYEPKATYSKDFGTFMGMRKQASAGKKINNVDAVVLLEKIASKKDEMPPSQMIELLSEFDKRAGIEALYDMTIRDPIHTVYGSISPVIEKYAEGITETDLTKSAANETVISKLAAAFGKEMATDFSKSPVGIYESMPEPEKALIADIIKG